MRRQCLRNEPPRPLCPPISLVDTPSTLSLGPGPHLEGSDLIHFLKSEPDVVESVQEAVLAECVYLKGEGGAVVPNNGLGWKVDL